MNTPKLILLHADNTYNLGSFMMAINLVHYLKWQLGSIQIEGKLNSESDRARFQKEINSECEIIPYIPWTSKHKNLRLQKIENIFLKLPKRITELASKKPEAIIILGGDDLSEYYQKWQVIQKLFYYHRLNHKIPVFLVGQTIGPFSSYRKYLAKLFLKRLYIYSRDSISWKYLLEDLKLKGKVFLSSDLAFLDLPNQNKQYTLKKYILHDSCYITLVPSALVKQYGEFDSYISSWAKIINMLHKKFPGKKIVLLPHVTRPEDCDDRKIISALMNKAGNKSYILPIVEELLPSEARFILGHGLFTITGRMHAAISTFQMRKPAISLSYSVKYKGIIGEDLRMSELIIESKGNDLWKSGNIVEEINTKVDYITRDYDKIITVLNKRIPELQEKVHAQIDDIANKIRATR